MEAQACLSHLQARVSEPSSGAGYRRYLSIGCSLKILKTLKAKPCTCTQQHVETPAQKRRHSLRDSLPNAAPTDRIKSGGRLVKNHHRWCGDHGTACISARRTGTSMARLLVRRSTFAGQLAVFTKCDCKNERPQVTTMHTTIPIYQAAPRSPLLLLYLRQDPSLTYVQERPPLGTPPHPSYMSQIRPERCSNPEGFRVSQNPMCFPNISRMRK